MGEVNVNKLGEYDIIYIAEYISKLKCVSVEEVISTTNKVACELFDLDIKL